MDLYSLSTYDYELPEELVAQHPVSPRDLSRLMLVQKATGTISEARFLDLPDILNQNDTLIFNNTKVAPARFLGCRRGGGKAEILLLKSCGDGSWEALVRPGRKLQPGAIIQISNELSCEVLEICRDGMRRVRFITQGD